MLGNIAYYLPLLVCATMGYETGKYIILFCLLYACWPPLGSGMATAENQRHLTTSLRRV